MAQKCAIRCFFQSLQLKSQSFVSLMRAFNIPQRHQSNSSNNQVGEGEHMKYIKLKSILCGLAMVFSLMSVKTNAGTLGDLTYEIANGEVTITKCSPSAEGELGVPDEIEGLPAISIGERAFRRLHWSDERDDWKQRHQHWG